MTTSDPTAIRLADLCAALQTLGIPAGPDLIGVAMSRGEVRVTRWPDGESGPQTSIIHIDPSGYTP